MPLTNLDYMFHFGEFEETVVIATKAEPSNAGFVLVRPNATAYDQVQAIMAEKGRKLSMGILIQ